MNQILVNYINSVCHCRPKNESGKNNQLINSIDFFLLLAYTIIAGINTFSSTPSAMVFFLTLMMILRSLLKFLKERSNHRKQKKSKKGNSSILPFYSNQILFYSGFFIVAVILYFVFGYYRLTVPLKWLIIAYYVIFFFVQTNEILIDSFEATPDMYIRY